jgi:hypothetical protein
VSIAFFYPPQLITELIGFPYPEQIDYFPPYVSPFAAGNIAYHHQRHLKIILPTNAPEDMSIIYAIFADLVISCGFGKLSADCRRQKCPLHSLPGAPLPGFAGLGSFDRKLIMYLVYTSGLIFMRPYQE